MNYLIVSSLLAGWMACASVSAADTSPAKTAVPAGFTALIAGHDLIGWQEAAKAGEHWKIENGELINDGKGTDLVTAKSYRNFELMLEWKIPLRGDSGVYLPGGQQVQIWAKDSGSGGFVFNHKYTVSPAVVADRPLGEWNSFHIKLLDNKVTVTLNGKVVMQDVPVEKGFDPPMLGPVEGPLRLQKSPHNVVTTFRAIYIREL
ncbi:MAG: DUF1080 domain-containing protein [Proteobacteria bacterium]|nr:DUF1080 domain-containing protein [Pseudomonadota bacterium]